MDKLKRIVVLIGIIFTLSLFIGCKSQDFLNTNPESQNETTETSQKETRDATVTRLNQNAVPKSEIAQPETLKLEKGKDGEVLLSPSEDLYPKITILPKIETRFVNLTPSFLANQEIASLLDKAVEDKDSLIVEKGKREVLKEGKYFFKEVKVEGLLELKGDVVLICQGFELNQDKKEKESGIIDARGTIEHPDGYNLTIETHYLRLNGEIIGLGFSQKEKARGNGSQITIKTLEKAKNASLEDESLIVINEGE